LGFNSPSNDKKGKNKKSLKFYPRKKNSGWKSPVSWLSYKKFYI
jgi:hypothetical protein